MKGLLVCVSFVFYSLSYILLGFLCLFACFIFFEGERGCNLDTFNSQLGDLYNEVKIVSSSVSSFL